MGMVKGEGRVREKEGREVGECGEGTCDPFNF